MNVQPRAVSALSASLLVIVTSPVQTSDAFAVSFDFPHATIMITATTSSARRMEPLLSGWNQRRLLEGHERRPRPIGRRHRADFGEL